MGTALTEQLKTKTFLDAERWIESLRKEKYQLSLTRRIVAEPYLVGAIISGKHRIGKSAYALWVMYELYKDWDTVFKYMAYSVKDFMSLLRSCLDGGVKVPCILWDDAGGHGSKYLWNIDRLMVFYLKNLLDVIGTSTKGLIMTTISGEDLLKIVREYEFYKVKISLGRHKYDRVARGYEIKRSPLNQKSPSILFDDYFDVRVPIYEKYYEMRKQYSRGALDRLESLLDKIEKTDEPVIPHDEEDVDWLHGDISGPKITRKEYNTHANRDWSRGIKARSKEWGVKYASLKE